MSIREIKIFPDPVLRKKCEPVMEFGDDLKKLVDDLAETMYEKDGVGLAAPQIGESKRMVVIDIRNEKNEEKNTLILINPEIVEKAGDIVWNEGCLSFPGIYEEIKRADIVVVNAVDPGGVKFTVEGEGLLAVALQHEIDHLDGILIYDYMSFIRKKLVKREMKKKVEKIKKETETADQGVLL